MTTAAAVVPAAGRGTRFGATPKQLTDIGGMPMLERTVRSLLDAGVAPVVVVTEASAVLGGVAALHDARVRVVVNPDPSRGMFSSIREGLAAASGDPILVLPGDMPFVARDTIAALLAVAALDAVVAPRYRGRRGHPVMLPARLRDRCLEAPPDSTLSNLIDDAGEERVYVDVDDPGILRDVDTPHDLTSG